MNKQNFIQIMMLTKKSICHRPDSSGRSRGVHTIRDSGLSALLAESIDTLTFWSASVREKREYNRNQ